MAPSSKSFLERLDDEAKHLLMAVARPISHAKGNRLVRYGEPSRGAYLLNRGSAEATVLLPGGEKLVVARLEAGGVFGEMALIERGTCTATVTAAEPLEGWFIERDDFRSLVAQRVPAALRVQHAVTLALSEKLRALNARVHEVPAPEDKPARRAKGADPLADNPQRLFLAHTDAPERWSETGVLLEGGKHYGYLDVHVERGDDGWQARLEPIYQFPLMNASGELEGFEPRAYEDIVVLESPHGD